MTTVKKTGARLISFVCCAALLLSMFAILPPLKASADTNTVNLYIEGTNATVFQGPVALQSGDTAYDVIIRALGANGYTSIASNSNDVDSSQWANTFFMKESSYGKYIQRIGAYSADSSSYWGVYINGGYAASGISTLKPTSGDTLIVSLADLSQYLPEYTLSTAHPVRGSQLTVQIKGTITTGYDAEWNPITVTENISGTKVTVGDSAATTGSDGKATLTMPSSAGDYSLIIGEHDDASGYAFGIRRVVPLKVYNSAGSDGYDLSADDSVDVSTATQLSASLGTVTATADGKSATLGADKSITVRNGSTVLRAALSAGTVISGPAGWDGSLLLPQVVNVTVPGGTTALAVQLGANGQDLTLSKPARLVLPGMSGKQAGYIDAAGDFHRILTKLTSDAAPADAGSGYTAVYDNGTDLIIYTTHFTTFVAYKDTAAVTDAVVASAITSAGSVLKEKDKSQWAAFALARAGLSGTDDYLDELKAAIDDKTEYQYPATLAKGVFTLAANGYDPSDFDGVNLTEKLYNFDNIKLSGLNGPVYALLALDAADVTVPADAKWTKEKLLSAILAAQKSDGSFSLDSTQSGDADMTAITLTALAAHISDSNVKAAADKAVAWLSAQQQNDGGYTTIYGKSSETVSQVIVALSSLKIDVKTDARFLKNSKSLLDNLMAYQLSSGGFEHMLGKGLDNTATEQALMALTAYSRYTNAKTNLYDLSDISADKVVKADAASSQTETVTRTYKSTDAVKNPQTGSSPVFPASAAVLCFAALLAPLARKAIAKTR